MRSALLVTRTRVLAEGVRTATCTMYLSRPSPDRVSRPAPASEKRPAFVLQLRKAQNSNGAPYLSG